MKKKPLKQWVRNRVVEINRFTQPKDWMLKLYTHGCFHKCLQIIFGWEQREENNRITRNSSRSDILTLLTLLSADARSAVLLRVLSLTKAEVRNFPLLCFPKWLCLVHGQLAMSLRRVKGSVLCKCQCFCLSYIQQWPVLSYVLLSLSHKFPIEEIQLSVKYYSFSLNFH